MRPTRRWRASGQFFAYFGSRAELVATVQKALGKEASSAQAERTVDAVIEGIKTGVKKTKSVQLVGFGTFKIATPKICSRWRCDLDAPRPRFGGDRIDAAQDYETEFATEKGLIQQGNFIQFQSG